MSATKEEIQQQTITAIAPSDLPEGYKLQVTQNNVNYIVEVPAGGVAKDQSFTALGTVVASGVPMGEWRDGLCDCCAQGPCHPSLWCAICCPEVLTSQVMTRMKLNFLAEPGTEAQVKNTFKIVLGLFIAYFIVVQVISLVFITYDQYGVANPSVWVTVREVIAVTFFVYSLMIIWKTRSAIRRKYDIPVRHCGGCEDFCCAFFCSPCTAAQMARHTADYNKDKAKLLTNNGLEKEIEDDATYVSMA